MQDGEQQRGGAPLLEAGQVPAAPARELRAVAQVRLVRKVVRLHRQGQPPERVEDALRSIHFPGKS